MLAAVTKPEWQRWAQPVETHIAILHQVHSKLWKTQTQVLHVQPVKSCAAHVDHMVLDVNHHPCSLID